MSYLQRNNRNNNRGRFIKNIIFVVVVLIIISIVFPGFGSSFSRNLVYPFWAVKEKVLGGNSLESILRSKNSLVAENEHLKDLVTEQRLQVLTAEEVRKENEELRSILNNLDGRQAVNGDILARPPISAYDTFVISSGSDAGIEVGQKVVAYGEVHIGEVVEVEKDSSLIRLYSAPGNSFQSFATHSSDVIELEGKGSGNFSAEVPKGVSIDVGDKLFLEGSQEVLGVIEEIESEDSDSFKILYVKSPINIFKLKRVQILI